MRQCKFIAFSAVVLLSASCTQEDELITQLESTSQETSFRISKEEAIKTANAFFEGFDQPTRRSHRRVSSVETVGQSETSVRSSGEYTDTLLYIINYEDNQGFAIVGADKRALPLYGISENGHFEITDETPEPVKATLYNSKQDVMSRIVSDTTTVKPNTPWLGWKGWDHDIQYKIGPLISQYQSRLNHGLPYSKYCKTTSGEPAATGCVMVATEQIMSYHKWPNKFEYSELDWDTMNNGENDDHIARLLWYLGSPDLFNAKYKKEGPAGAFTFKTPDVFKKMGYKDPGELISFFDNIDIVTAALQTKGPVFMNAYYYAEKPDETTSGHAWVVDGMIRYKVEPLVLPPVIWGQPEPSINYRYYNLFHCVWNFGGDCNGYYFLEFEGVPVYRDPIDNGSDESSKYIHYNSTIYCIPGFEPIKYQ